jgi:hypothetical protein
MCRVIRNITEKLVWITGFGCPILSEKWQILPEVDFYRFNSTASDVGLKNLPA